MSDDKTKKKEGHTSRGEIRKSTSPSMSSQSGIRPKPVRAEDSTVSRLSKPEEKTEVIAPAKSTSGEAYEETVAMPPETTGLGDSPAPSSSTPPTISPAATIPGAATSSDAASQMFGRYQILQELGRGGMGVVYKAADPQLNRTVALKVLLAQERASKEQTERFLVEARATAQLDHPNIVRLFEIGEMDGKQFFTMDFIPGSSLKDLIKEKKVGLKKGVKIMVKVARGIHYAHEKGIIHRDLKPANIMVTEEGEPIVMDFGLAKMSKEKNNLTKTGTIMGTPVYMPPEQAEGRHRQIDARSDVYSLGAILYEILTGRQVFQGTILELLKKIAMDDPPPPTQVNPKVPEALERICLKAMAKDKEKRYQSARELARDLDRFAEGKEVEARKSGQLARWLSRSSSKIALIVGAVVLVLLVVVLSRPTTSIPQSPQSPQSPQPLVSAMPLLQLEAKMVDEKFQARREFTVGEKVQVELIFSGENLSSSQVELSVIGKGVQYWVHQAKLTPGKPGKVHGVIQMVDPKQTGRVEAVAQVKVEDQVQQKKLEFVLQEAPLAQVEQPSPPVEQPTPREKPPQVENRGSPSVRPAQRRPRQASSTPIPPLAKRKVKTMPGELFNGGFEFGWSGWGTGQDFDQCPDQVWLCSGNCDSEADIDITEVQSGKASLHIVNRTPFNSKAPNVFAMTSQPVHVKPNQFYCLALQAKATNLQKYSFSETKGGLFITVDKARKIIPLVLECGTYDWKSASAVFCSSSEMMEVSIVSDHVGEIWIDEIQLYPTQLPKVGGKWKLPAEPALQNGDFEQSLNGWGNWSLGKQNRNPGWLRFGSCKAVGVVEPQQGRNGSVALHIQNPITRNDSPHSFAGIGQVLRIQPKQDYQLTFWARATDIRSTESIVVIISGGTPETWIEDGVWLPAGSFGWTQFSLRFASQGKTPQLQIHSGGGGDAWIDDIQILETEKK